MAPRDDDETEGGGRLSAAGRERIGRAAYELFSRDGVGVGVDTIVARAGTAKMTLYRHFASKDELILDFLERREQRWIRGWLQAECLRRGATPRARLLAVFEIFGEWFAEPDFEGCSFLSTMIEVRDPANPVRRASVERLATIRAFLAGLAAEAGAGDPDGLARKWHILMKGSIMAAHEGDVAAAGRAAEVAELLLAAEGI